LQRLCVAAASDGRVGYLRLRAMVTIDITTLAREFYAQLLDLLRRRLTAQPVPKPQAPSHKPQAPAWPRPFAVPAGRQAA